MNTDVNEVSDMIDGIYFEAQHQIRDIIDQIGMGEFDRAVDPAKKLKALLRHSKMLEGITPADTVMYGSPEKYLAICIAQCDQVIEHLLKLSKSEADRRIVEDPFHPEHWLTLGELLSELSDLNSRVNHAYQFHKTNFDLSGSFKLAKEIYQKEGIA